MHCFGIGIFKVDFVNNENNYEKIKINLSASFFAFDFQYFLYIQKFIKTNEPSFIYKIWKLAHGRAGFFYLEYNSRSYVTLNNNFILIRKDSFIEKFLSMLKSQI